MEPFSDDERPVVLITGATGGIGRGIAEALLQAGYRVALNSRKLARCAAVREELINHGFPDSAISAVAADTTSAERMEGAVGDIVDRWGRVDGLVTAAGVLARGSVTSLKIEDFAAALQTNVLGTWLAIRCVAPYMRRAGFGRIVTIGSVLGSVGAAERSGYAATKGAVGALTRALALELADAGITVNCVAPGPIRTSMNEGAADLDVQAALLGTVPLGRWGTPAEVAHMVLTLLSPAASFITGSIISVDGGYLAH